MLTKKRQEVLSILQNTSTALSAYDVVEQYNARFKADIKAMSVYRILANLQKQHLVHKISSSQKFIACTSESCQFSGKLALFLICKSCHMVIEKLIDTLIFEKIKKIAAVADYTIASNHIEIDCICKSCK